MSTICQQWKDRFCPITSGLFYADDTFQAAALDKSGRTLSFGERRRIPSDIKFAAYHESGSFSCDVGYVRWGEGSWEGEGWIALEDRSSVPLWIMHFEDSEPFTQARYAGGIIEAVAYQYPLMSLFTIPTLSPDLATFSTESD